VDYCRYGPTAAKVENIEINYEKYKGEFSGFETL
jgi:acylphosphatase